MQDSVVGGNVHTGNIVHNHYHAAPQPVVQQTHTVVHQTHTPAVAYVPQTAQKGITEAYLMWFFLGIFGGHRFYLGHVGIGILYLCTCGGFFIGWFIDAFLMPELVMQANNPNLVGQHPYH